MKKFETLRKDDGGVVAVEFALLAPVICLFAFYTIEAGEALFQYRRMAQAAEAASRMGSQYVILPTISEAPKLESDKLPIIRKALNAVVQSDEDLPSIAIVYVSKSLQNGRIYSRSFPVQGEFLETSVNIRAIGKDLTPGAYSVIGVVSMPYKWKINLINIPLSLSANYVR